MDDEVKMMLNAILEEMGRVEERTNKRFDKIENQLEIMIEELEKKTA